MKKSLVCKITATRCSPCLLFSVKKKEKESLVKKGREKTHCNFWMNFSTATWTLSIISPSSPILLSHVYSAYINYTGIVYKKINKNCLQPKQQGVWPNKLYLFYALNRPISCNSPVSNGWLCLFPFCFSVMLLSLSLCTSPRLFHLWCLDFCGSGVGFLGLSGLRGSCGWHGAAIASCKRICARTWPCKQAAGTVRALECLLSYSSPASFKSPL